MSVYLADNGITLTWPPQPCTGCRRMTALGQVRLTATGTVFECVECEQLEGLYPLSSARGLLLGCLLGGLGWAPVVVVAWRWMV